MSLTATQIAQIFKAFGVPQAGAGFAVAEFSTLFGPFAETYDYSALVTALNARIAALNAEQETQAAALLAEWETITDYSELAVDQAAGAGGTLSNHARRRDRIRDTLANLLGFYCPPGGFVASVRPRGGRLTR